MSKKRTPGGSIKASVRKKTSALSDSRFPIFSKRTALSALRLRGHATTDGERKKIIAKAAKYAPEAAKAARMTDKKR